MERNDKLTSPTLRQKIRNEFGIDFSESKIKRLRKKLLWVQTSTKYCQLIKEANRVKQLAFCILLFELMICVKFNWKRYNFFTTRSLERFRNKYLASDLPTRAKHRTFPSSKK